MATKKPYTAQPMQTIDFDRLNADILSLQTAEPESPRGLLRGAADLGLEAASGAAKGIKFMSDVFGADNPVSQGLQGVSDFAKELQSAQARGEDQRIAQLMKEAEDKGIGEQVKAALRAAGEAPVRQAIGAIGTSVPMIAASMVPGLREASWGTRAAALGGMGGAQGVGVVKSQMYDAVYQRAIEEGRGEQEARALAQQAQAYSPENAGDIALGGALGFSAALTGFEPAAARAVGGAAAKAAASKTAQRGLMQSTLRGTLAEAIPEATQGFQEQVAGNRAEQRAGFDTPTFRGAAGSATLEGLLSAPGGAVGGMLDARGAKPAPKLLANQIRATESVPETGPMTRAANQAVEAKAQQVEMTAGAESAALAAMEQQARDDLQGLRDFAGRSPDVVAGMPVAGAQPTAPGADPSAEFIDSPFLDRIQTVQEMLADPATREKVRARWGDEGLNNIAYYAGMANRTGLPEKTQDNLLGMAERLLSESVLTPIQPTPELDGMRRDPLTLGNQPQPAAPALGMDGTPSGRFTVDPQGNVSPESRAQRGDAQRRADEIDSLGRQTPRGRAQPEATMQGALGIGMDTAPTGRLLAGQDGVRPETRMDAINIGQADMQRQADAAQRAEVGLTPDIEAVQQRNAMRPQDGDILNPSGKPFKTLMAAQRAAKKSPGEIVEVTGGFAIRPATMVAAQPEVANDGRGNQAAAGLAEALAGSNPEAGDRATAGASAVAPGEMLDALPGQPAGAQPAQGNAGQGQRVGREGYDTPVELDAASLKAIIEKTRGEPLATKPAKLEAWRNGTAKTDPNKYPVELAFTTDGRLDVNDGRHRIALAAERGEKVTAFIDGKDAQRAQELLANVQNLPQPAAAQAPADQAPEAARGDGATPAGVPDQGGAAAAVEAAGVGDANSIAKAITASIAERAIKSNQKHYADQVAKGRLSQEDADKRAAADAKTWSNQGVSERTQKLADAIAKKDPTVLVGAWAREGQGTYGNEGSMAAFEKMTGIKLRRLNSADRAKAIFDWAGWTEEQVAADVAQRKQAKAERDAAYEAKRQTEEDDRITERAGREMIQFRDTNETQPIRDYIDGLIAKGFNKIHAGKTGAITKTYLINEKGSGYPLPKGIVRDYAETAARRAAQQPAPNAAPANDALPETGGAITAADVAAAEKQAAQMIEARIDAMKAPEVQRIAARFLPTVGVKVPMGKAKIKAAMTDASAMNLLRPAGELGIELSESVKRALVAKMEGRVGAEQAAVQPSLDAQLAQVNDELAAQGMVQNANTRQKRDQLRTAIAERDFSEILKAVDGSIDAAEALHQAFQFSGNEPKAQTIERVLKHRGIAEEYRKRWAERLLAESKPAGREGYDTPVELDAAQLKAILEQTRGEPLVDKPAKLEAWRNGTANTDPAKFPIELVFRPDGKLDVNDGRHRIALAAERGEKVTAFIDGKDAQRAKDLLSAVDDTGTGPFGPILTQYRGNAQGAIKALTELQDGEAVAALNHPDVGDIDLVWGKAPEGKSEGFGLAKLVAKHQEVLGDLQGFISRLIKDDKRSGANRIRLVDPKGEAVVSLDWKGDRKVWLLTAYEKGVEAGTTMDTASNGSKGDTARLGPDAESSLSQSGQNAQAAKLPDAALEAIFDQLDGITQRTQAAGQQAAAAHPQAERIQLVQKHILDILEDLEDSGKVTINC